ncbi:oxygenase MpaB family protein [Kutzneria buriramensis]|uniref:Uncharacterized protein (DUF2236 family) n=1 Tax=Kutzneria buriramensis TaxID=1045776 RepID=A0A3E0HEL1_9PSEU|nr:oxygenase MpaB family protein [Kutzneria buriramensis]REH42841.1 uncharacterized protein (DUF2236 family) [Kutzneria buriramensis]
MSAEPSSGADPGLVGPNSVSWQLHADPAMWLAGIAGLYLQSLHPLAAAGVVQNSNFREDPLGRLIRTAKFVSMSTYAPRAEVEAGAARVRAVHRSLRGKDPATGRTFRIDRPDLLLWVHCAEVAMFLSVVRRAGFGLTKAQADRYFDEQRGSAALVGLDPDEVPGSTEQMAAYLHDMRGELRRGDDSEVVYEFLHKPPVRGVLGVGLPIYEPAVAHLAYSLLPSWAIRLHGHRAYSPTTATTMLRTLRSAAFIVPAPIRWRAPHGFVPQAMRRLGRSARPTARSLPLD